TPSRLAWLSRPLREEPRPFLCAIRGRLLLLGRALAGGGARGDVGDLDARQRLAVTRPPPVAPFGLELEHAQLLPALVADDAGRDLHLLQAVGVEDDVVGAKQHRLELNRVALSAFQLLDQQRLP